MALSAQIGYILKYTAVKKLILMSRFKTLLVGKLHNSWKSRDREIYKANSIARKYAKTKSNATYPNKQKIPSISRLLQHSALGLFRQPQTPIRVDISSHQLNQFHYVSFTKTTSKPVELKSYFKFLSSRQHCWVIYDCLAVYRLRPVVTYDCLARGMWLACICLLIKIGNRFFSFSELVA